MLLPNYMDTITLYRYSGFTFFQNWFSQIVKLQLHALSLSLGVNICLSLLNTLVGKWLRLYVF